MKLGYKTCLFYSDTSSSRKSNKNDLSQKKEKEKKKKEPEMHGKTSKTRIM